MGGCLGLNMKRLYLARGNLSEVKVTMKKSGRNFCNFIALNYAFDRYKWEYNAQQSARVIIFPAWCLPCTKAVYA